MDEFEELCYPEEEDDFEDRYADELEVMEEIGGDGPPSRKSLNFNDQSNKPAQSINTDPKIQSTSSAKKRSNDDMYGLISDDDDDDDNLKTLQELDVDILGPCKKRSRHTSPGNKGFNDFNHNLSPVANGIKTYNKTGSPFDKNTVISTRSSLLHKAETPTVQRNGCSAFRRPPMDKEAITITKTDGQRLYLVINNESDDFSTKAKSTRNQSQKRTSSLQLLQVPFSVLRQHVDEERRRKMAEDSDKIAASLRRALENEDEDMETCEEIKNQTTPQIAEHILWVEKYSPKLFTELLSDDAINRTLLKWLKLWDRVVFNKSNVTIKPKTTKQGKEDEKDKLKLGKGNKKFHKGGIDSEEWIEVDSKGYPVRKIALLCGPPGLGKTTLAHVIARHAGYNVVEMNASDDRSADIFKQKIETATQMQSVLGAHEKPNCLVIDEIDGAPAAAINILLSFIKKKDADGTKKNKKRKQQTLARPIICICNDQFVPALRQLRQQALIAVFPKTIPGRLSSRLNEISRREGIKTDMTTLLALCDKADNDIRSCLNTLQFVQRRHGCLSMEYVQSNNVGQKDLHKNLFTIMQEIFQLPKPKKKRFTGFKENAVNESKEFLNSIGLNGEAGLVGNSVSPLTSRFHNTLRSASSCGQFDKLAQGLFENYLNIKFKDSGLNALLSGTEWLEFADFIEQQIQSTQQYTLRRYSPFLSVAFHLLYATPSSSKLSYPSSQYECYVKQTKMSSLLTTIKTDASPRIRSVLDERIACLELFPSFLEIITPNMRPVNMQLFSTREKQQMSELIDSMIAYSMTYHQERNIEGQYNYVLDPNIEEIVKFPSLPQHKQLTYATKQLIAREIDLEKMRRVENTRCKRNGFSEAPAQTFVKKASNKTETTPKEIPEKKFKYVKEKVALDFFGQPIKPKTKENTKEGQNTSSTSADQSSTMIWFKFNEGYSNAVRKNVKVQDLL